MDGQTDRFAISISRVSILMRDKNRQFIIPLAFDAPVRGVPIGISALPVLRNN